MNLLKLNHRFLNLDLVVDAQVHADGSLTVSFAAPGPNGAHSTVITGDEAKQLGRLLAKLATRRITTRRAAP